MAQRKGIASLLFLTSLLFGLSAVARADPAVLFSASGATPAAIQASVDAFRAQLGTLNPNVAGSFGSGRREINWDGVPATFSAPNNLTANFFNVNSPRGAVFSTPGSGFQVSGATTDAGAGQPAAARFGNINPTYTDNFQTFSPQRLFIAIGSTITDVNFFVPGSTTPALVSGFGAVFTDVDLSNMTSLQFFDSNNNSLGTFFVAAANNGLSFVGVTFGQAIVSRVRITSGNTALGPTDQNGNPVDVVAMDDFIYAEPVATPEPTTVLLLGTGLAGIAAEVLKRRKTV